MRVFAISDLHVDYHENARWLHNLSVSEYVNDLLIVAGDVSHSLSLLQTSLTSLVKRFRKVMYVPGNHELWIVRDGAAVDSLKKFAQVRSMAEECGVSTRKFDCESLCLVPLLGWYDYSFAAPTSELSSIWMDFHACRWPNNLSMRDVCSHFLGMNDRGAAPCNRTVISFSHFLPRIDLMPSYIPSSLRVLYPILGTTLLEEQLRQWRPCLHVYGHSHINRRVSIDGVAYVNNAYGYPSEGRITAKQLLCIWES